MITLAILGIIGVAVGIRWTIMRPKRLTRAERHMPIPLIALPNFEELDALPRPAVKRRRPSTHHRRDVERPVLADSAPHLDELAEPPAPPAPPAPSRARPDELVTADSMRFAPPPAHRGNGSSARRPADGTLQFLPGRLEVVDGQDLGQEIRFVRQPNADQTAITFGRSEGPPYQHVQLSQATVSRNHARMTLDGSTWLLTNLSETNPVTVNGRQMDGVDASVVLRDGDRIEMGEVAFRFRDR